MSTLPHRPILLLLSRRVTHFQKCCYCFKLYRKTSPNEFAPPQKGTKIPDLEKFEPDKIRNFGIVAHVDHGKSTLADRLLTITDVIKEGERDQFLDKLQVERERGITVKAQTCSMVYKGHLLNLIDTPGHADFNFEVTRSLAACNGILLLVAANEGIKAQTKKNFQLAFERDLTIIPVINKIDMKNANIPGVAKEMSTLGFNEEEILKISARKGLNVTDVLDKIIEDIPAPTAKRDASFRALIFDSWFIQKRGAIPMILVTEGCIKPGQKIRSYHNKTDYTVHEVGIMYPEMQPTGELYAGQVGYITCGMKNPSEAGIGETLFDQAKKPESIQVFPGFKPNMPTVFSGLYPVDTSDYQDLEKALEKLMLNDPSVTMTKESSQVLGLGFKMGYLGMLHMEVFGQRLKDEYDADIILTSPTVRYKAIIKDNETIRKKRYNGEGEIFFTDASEFPDLSDVESFEEPTTKITLEFPKDRLPQITKLCQAYRGQELESKMGEVRHKMVWKMPNSEIMVDFFDKLMSITSGEVLYDQEYTGYWPVNLIKIGISINDKFVNEFSVICPSHLANERGRFLVDRLAKEIPPQQFEVVIRACVGTSKKGLATAKIKPLKKDFTLRLKGKMVADRLGKKLKDQAKGKEKLKQIGNVQVPKETFINVIKRDW